MHTTYRPHRPPTDPDPFTRLDLMCAACQGRRAVRQTIRHTTARYAR